MWEINVEQLRNLVADENPSALREALENIHPADAGQMLAELESNEIARYIEVVGPEQALSSFEFVPFERQKEILPALPRDVLVKLITIMSPDDRADLVEELDGHFQERLLSLLLQAERQNILRLITFPEDTAGAHLTTDYAILRRRSTVEEAFEQVRLQAPTKETIYYIYVVDEQRRLAGIVSLRDLIMAKRGQRVSEVMNEKVIFANVNDDIESVAQMFTHYDFLAMPVVDGDGRLLGIITFDDVFDVMTEEATEDMYHLANLDTDEKISTPVARSVRLRAPWLMVNLTTAILSAYCVSLFTGTISQFVVLAALMPIIATLGGNAGNQSLTVMVRALALGEVEATRNWRLILKAMAVGSVNGILVGLIIAVIIYFWHGNVWLAAIVVLAMICNMTIGGMCGALVPIVLRKLKLDPALGSSILITTATDVGGFVTFLGLATLLMSHLT